MGDKIFYGEYLTRTMCCPPTCGAGAVIICSESFAKEHAVNDLIEIVGQTLTTDTSITWENPIDLSGADMTRRAAEQVYEQAGIGPESVDVPSRALIAMRRSVPETL